MNLTTVLLIILILIFAGVFPGVWAHSQTWGYGPSSAVGFVLVIIVILILLGKL